MFKKINWILHCLLYPVEYSANEKGQLVVREWFNKPVEVMTHLRRDHGLSEAEINDVLMTVRRLTAGEKVKPPSHAGDNMDDPFNEI